MAETYVKFEQFIEDVYHGVHDFDTDTIKVAFSNAANPPSVSADAVLGDITTVSTANLDTDTLVKTSSGQTTGTYGYVPADITMTASGAVGPYQYIIIYNSTANGVTNPLICYFNKGAEESLASGETISLDFGANLFSAA